MFMRSANIQDGQDGSLVPADENTPLLSNSENQESSAARFVRGLSNFGASTWRITKTVARFIFRPITLAVLIAIIGSIYSSINSLMGPSNMSPAQLGAEWWASMTSDVIFWSIALAAGSEIDNTLNNTGFYLNIIPRLKNGYHEARKSRLKALLYGVSLFFALGSGLSIGAIAWESAAFLQGGYIVFQIFIALLTFLSIVSGRMLSLAQLSDDVTRRFEVDGRILLRFGKTLEQLNPIMRRRLEGEVRQIVNAIARERESGDIRHALKPQEFQLLLRRLANKMLEISRNSDTPLIIARTKTAIFFDGAQIGLRGIVALTTTGASFMVFNQKQWDGINIIARHISDHNIQGVPRFAQAIIGIPGGMASGVFYGKSTYAAPDWIIDTVYYCLQKPWMIPAMIGLLFCVGASGAGSTTVVNGIANNTGNIFEFVPETGYTMAGTFLLVMGAIFANLASSMQLVLNNPEMDLVTFRYIVNRILSLSDRLEMETQDDICQFLDNRSNNVSIAQFSIFGPNGGGDTANRDLVPVQRDGDLFEGDLMERENLGATGVTVVPGEHDFDSDNRVTVIDSDDELDNTGDQDTSVQSTDTRVTTLGFGRSKNE